MHHRVLLIEDEPLLQRVISRMLPQGCTVTVAASVDQAMDELGVFDFDVVVADLELGGAHRDGRWLLQQVERKQPHARRLLISGHHRELDEGGHAHACLPKPFSRQQLVDAVVEGG